MHRTIDIAVPQTRTDGLLRALEKHEGVIGLSVVRGASVKPPGDVVTVHALNRGADEVMCLAEAAHEGGLVSVTTHELTSIVDPEHERKVAKDVDEALWEEIETNLRHGSRVTGNYLTLMALGGAVAATGFVEEGTPQAIAFVAAAVIAPAFEPLAKIPFGLALRRWDVAWRGLFSATLGYAALVISAALAFLVLRLADGGAVETLLANPSVRSMAEPSLGEVLVSASGALAGMVMLVSQRRYLIPGALIALMVVEAAALVGVALAAGQPALAYEGLERFALDVALILASGVLVVALKQAIVHRRAPMV